jgi:hypothetical protein
MNWKFWQKQPTQAATAEGVKLPKPKEIHSAVGRHLVVNMGRDPDWVWSLKGVSRPRGNPKSAFDIRAFDASEAGEKGIVVKDYYGHTAFGSAGCEKHSALPKACLGEPAVGYA